MYNTNGSKRLWTIALLAEIISSLYHEYLNDRYNMSLSEAKLIDSTFYKYLNFVKTYNHVVLNFKNLHEKSY